MKKTQINLPYKQANSTFEEQKNRLNSRREDILLKDVLEMWMFSIKHSVKGSTLYKYEYLIEKHINPQLGKVPMYKLNTKLISLFLEEKIKHGSLDQEKGLSVNYVKSMLAVIRAAIDYAVSENICNPIFIKIKFNSFNDANLFVFSRQEQSKLRKHLDTNTNPTGTGILISMYTGLRIGEICALTWDDIDTENKIIHVNHTISRVKETEGVNTSSKLIIDKPKTKSSRRDIPISTALFPYLLRAKQQSSSIYVVSTNDRFVSPRTYEYRYHQILEECSVSQLNYHALRHTFATRCVEADMDVKTLSEILGHSNVSTTLNTYVHSSMELKRKQIEKLTVL